MKAMPLPLHALARVRRWQRGGTVTGVIVGLIVGLTVAVWVAMTILKTPLPFVDKISKQTQPAGELGDPNKTMPGGARERREHMNDEESAAPEKSTIVEPVAPPPAAKSAKAAKAEAAKTETTKTETTKTETAPAATNSTTSPATEKSRPEKSAAANSAQSSASSPTAAAPSPSAPSASATSAVPAPQPEGFTYYLQAGAFREITDADATKAKLALMGVAATIAERKSELGTLYRVRVGPFSDIEAMNRARVRLSDNGVDAAVVKVPK
jgi:cell division protein FtsN